MHIKQTASITVLALMGLIVSDRASADFEGDYSSGKLTYTSSALVMGLDGNVSSISPSVDDADIPGGTAKSYLESSSALGHYGPLSAYGPLGTLGPVGDNTWNISYWISAAGDWSDWSSDSFGVLGPGGPLGQSGPVSNQQYYGQADPGQTLFASNDFAVEMRGLGLWSVLGPIGPLGALGPLGPLGPVGAHGYGSNANGEYTHNGQVVRTIDVDYDGQGNTRTYELFEYYRDEDFAKGKRDNDTSFMVRGAIPSRNEPDIYTIRSEYDQLVTLLVVPEKELDDFDLAVGPLSTGPEIITHTGYETMEWVQMKVKAGTELAVAVSLYWTGHFLSSSYRLIVVGSGPELNETEITGNHIKVWQ